MQLEILSINIYENMENDYETKEILHRRRINLEVFPIETNKLIFKTGEIFMNPNELQYSKGDVHNDKDDDWNGKPRMSCIMELHEDVNRVKDSVGHDTNFYFSYFEGRENDAGVMQPSSLCCVINCGKDLINSVIENLRGNIKPKFVNIEFEFQKCLEDFGLGDFTRKSYEWDNIEETVLKIEGISFNYSI